ncbi:MAG: hypothetical protein CL453_00795 [Acidimicrobiaceae bacterium]|nr:hypothetical protein [Acidimicrobiaceae bacterium]
MAEEKSEVEEEYEDAEVDLDGVDPEDDAIEDVEDGEMFDDDDDDDDEEFEEDASLEEVAESEEEDDDDEVEADLSAILQERIAADDDEDEDESKDPQANTNETSDSEEPVSAKEDEVLCESCFTLVPQKAIDEEGACPNCGAEI